MRFRTHNVGIVADIEKAFLQVGLQPDQRDATRFLWMKDCENPSTERSNVQEYRFCRVPFGVISSPFILGATLEHHLDSYHTQIAEKLKKDIYVDNVISGTKTELEAIEMYTTSKELFKEATMNLREWSTNSKLVKEVISSEDRAQSGTIKVLGHLWNTVHDTLSLKESVELDKSPESSKRIVLKQLSSVYDPLGLFCPIVLLGKVLMQELWSKHLDWDDKLEPDDVTAWHTIRVELQKIARVTVQRCIALSSDGCVKYRLLCFCDASAKAYATTIYLHQEGDSEARSDLIFAKSRLAPTKQTSIPRLELMAVVIGVRCAKFVKENLHLPIEHVFIWSDSQCVLHWISSENASQVFVKNRVNEIKGHDISGFYYVPSAENPADVASRGSTTEKLADQNLWWFGPDWLTKRTEDWRLTVCEKKNIADAEHMCDATEGASEELPETTSAGGAGTASHIPPIESEGFSSVSKLIRVTAFVLRFVDKLRNQSRESGVLTTNELQRATRLWIAHIQLTHYGDVLNAITAKKPNNVQRQLGLYVDDSGILRCGGRLGNAELSEAARHPILLPKRDRFTRLMIQKLHQEQLHSGVSQTLSRIRYMYWIPSGRATVKSVLQECRTCRRHEGGAYKMPRMAPLPKSRVTEAPPFTKVGLNIWVRFKRKEQME